MQHYHQWDRQIPWANLWIQLRLLPEAATRFGRTQTMCEICQKHSDTVPLLRRLRPAEHAVIYKKSSKCCSCHPTTMSIAQCCKCSMNVGSALPPTINHVLAPLYRKYLSLETTLHPSAHQHEGFNATNNPHKAFVSDLEKLIKAAALSPTQLHFFRVLDWQNCENSEIFLGFAVVAP